MKKNGSRYKKENKPNVFEKAFEWYTKDLTKRNEDTEKHMVGFATWLDDKYVEYMQTKQKTNTQNKKNKDNEVHNEYPSFEDILKPNDVISTSFCICSARHTELDNPNIDSKRSKRKRRNIFKSQNNKTPIPAEKNADDSINHISNNNKAPPDLCRQGGFCCTAPQKPISSIEAMKEINETNTTKSKANDISTQTSCLTVFVTDNGKKVVKPIDVSSQTSGNTIFMVKELETHKPILLKIFYAEEKVEENAGK